MFNDAFHGYVELNAPFDLSNPSFKAKAWLRADARGAINGLVGEKAENVRPVVVALGRLLEMLTGNGSLPNIRELPGLLEQANVTVPPQVRTMTNVLGDAQDNIQRYAGPVAWKHAQCNCGYPHEGRPADEPVKGCGQQADIRAAAS